MGFQLLNYGLAGCTAQLVHFNEITVVIHGHHVVLAIEVEPIKTNLLPWSVSDFCWEKCLWLLLCMIALTYFTGGNVFLDVTTHPRPK